MAVGLGVSAVAPELVPLLLGEKWLPAVPLMQWLGIWGALMGAALTIDPLLLATGRSGLLASLKWLQLAVLAPALVYGGLASGVVGIAAAKTLVMIAMLPLLLTWISRAERLPLGRTFSAIGPACGAGIVMYAAVLGVAHLLADVPQWLRLIAEVATGAITYVTVVLGLWYLRGAPAGPEREVLERLRGKRG